LEVATPQPGVQEMLTSPAATASLALLGLFRSQLATLCLEAAVTLLSAPELRNLLRLEEALASAAVEAHSQAALLTSQRLQQLQQQLPRAVAQVYRQEFPVAAKVASFNSRLDELSLILVVSTLRSVTPLRETLDLFLSKQGRRCHPMDAVETLQCVQGMP
jgi:hypothetical protein